MTTRSFAASLAGTCALVSAVLAAPLASAAPSVWAVDDGLKVERSATSLPAETGVDNPVWAPGEPVRLFSLRNETIAFQVVVEADAAGLSGVTVDLDGLTGPNGETLANAPGATDPTHFVGRPIERFVEHYFTIDRESGGPWAGSLGWEGGAEPPGDWTGEVPDALIPVEVAPSWSPYPMEVPAHRNGAIWIDVTVPADQPAGLYTGDVVVAANGSTLATLPVELRVHDATLPDWPVKTMLYFNPANLTRRMGSDSGLLAQDHLLQLLHRHRLTPLHSAMTETDASSMMSALDGSLYTAAQGYEGPAEGRGDDVLALGVYGAYGAPDSGDLANVEAIADLLANAGVLPGMDVFVYPMDESCGHAWGYDWRTLLDGSANPNVQQHVESGWTCSSSPDGQPVDIVMHLASHYDPAEADAAEDIGKRVWAYNGVRPYTGSMLTDANAVSPRVNGWLSEMFGVDRWFYWQSTYWNDWNAGGYGAYDPFVEPETFHNTWDEWANGDGVLVYPGRQVNDFTEHSVGMDGVIASIRLKNWRRGVQDAGYLQLARAADPAAADAVADGLIPAAFSGATGGQQPAWSVEPTAWHQARADLLDVIGAGVPTDGGTTDGGTADDGTTDGGTTDGGTTDGGTTDDGTTDGGTTDGGTTKETLSVLRADGTVSVDGDLAEFTNADGVLIQAGGATADLRLIWDDEYLYLGADVADADLQTPGTGLDGPLWNADGVELMVDPLLTETASPDADDRHVVVTASGDLLDAQGAGSTEDVSLDMAVLRAVVADGTLDGAADDVGYTVEVAVPWADLGVSPAAGDQVGADLALNDVSGGTLSYDDWAGVIPFAQPAAWKRLEMSATVADVPCAPLTCAEAGATCGTASDGCGGTLDCGACDDGEACTDNQCLATCTPLTCAEAGATCGTASDGCGGTLDCGACPEPTPTPEPVDADHVVARAGATVTVDGDLSEFAAAEAVVVTAGDAEATFRLLWDDRNLYVAADVADDDLFADGTGRDGQHLWKSDGVEMMLDPTDDATKSPNADDRHVVITALGDLLDAAGAGSKEDTSLDMGIESAVVTHGTVGDRAADDGFTVEMAIPWHGIGVTPAAGLVMGADLALNDAGAKGYDTGDWADLSNYAKPHLWRTLGLSGDVAGGATCLPLTCEEAGVTCGTTEDGCGGTVDCGACPEAADLDVPRAPGAVSVDADLAEYDGAPAVVVQGASSEGTLRLLWDDQHLYLGATVLDEDLNAHGTGDDGELWNADSVEILLDPLHTRTDTPDGDDRHVIVSALGDVLDAAGAGSGEDRSVSMGVVSAVATDGTVGDGVADGGYVVEIAIPWSALGVEPTSGLTFGGDLAVNDASATGLTTSDWAGLADYAQPSRWKVVRLAADTAGAGTFAAGLGASGPESPSEASTAGCSGSGATGSASLALVALVLALAAVGLDARRRRAARVSVSRAEEKRSA
ncbi:MAG: sugar-binding protein [Myxococcota bacterium]